MTKEEVLQKANEYCTEKSYTSETLTNEFKDKFSDFFAKKYPDATAEDEAVIADLKFNLDTAFSATSKGVTSKQRTFDEKENEYKRQIAELNKKLGKKETPTPPSVEIPKEIEEQLAELRKFKDDEAKKSRLRGIIKIAKDGIRKDLHTSFERFVADYEVSLEKEDKEQADALVARFQEIFKDSVGDIKPLAPRVTQKRDSEQMSQLQKIKV